MGSVEKKLEEYQKHAEESGFIVNPNTGFARQIIESLLHCNGYCPCRKKTGIEEQDAKIKCPCLYHIEEVRKDGHCHCWLFVKK